MRERSPRCGEAVVWFTIEVHIEEPPDPGDDLQLALWEDPPDAGGPLPHPPGGTRWQRCILAQGPGPLIFGRPER